MKFGLFGTGAVSQSIGRKLVSLGHEVKMGARDAKNEKAAAFVRESSQLASQGTFSDAAQFGEVLVNATQGAASLDVLKSAGGENLDGKVLIDIANPLDFSKGMPPSLFVCNIDSLGERIQAAYPNLKVVKTFNTMNASVMVNPGMVPGPHDIFICGNDDQAKSAVIGLLKSFGWKDPIDLGDITSARATEMLLPIWIRLWGKLGTANFNFHIAR